MKKFLSLVLALVMTMSLVTVSAGAKEFTDDSKITYDEAVAVISAVGVVDGYTDGSFNPTNQLTRGAAAKIICNLVLGPTTASALSADAAPFSDVPTTNEFAGYIAYCSQQGIINGYNDGTFRPAAPLTGYAFLKMLLGALGYDGEVEGFTGPNWSIQVGKLALGIGLTKGNDDFVGTQYVNREEACLYSFNTLKADMVEYDAKTSVSVGGAEVVIAGSKAKVCAQGVYDDNLNDAGLQFAEKYFTKLTRTRNNTDAFGRPANEWKYGAEIIGKYADDTDLIATYAGSKAARGDLYTLVGSSVVGGLKDGDYDFTVYVDGKEVNIPSVDDYFVKSSSTAAGVSGNGVLTEVYMDDDNNVTIVMVNTYLVKATADYNSTKESLSIEVVDIDNDSMPPLGTLIDNDDVYVADFKDGDYILVTYSYMDKAIKSAEAAEVVTGEVSEFTVKTEVIMDGTTYKYNKLVGEDVSALEFTVGEDAKVVLDSYGYIIFVDEAISSNSYVYIENVGAYSTTGKTAVANAYFPDGTYDEPVIKKVDGKTGSAACQGARGWYTYSKDADGKLTLNSVQKPNADAYGYVNDSLYAGGVKVLSNDSIKFLNSSAATDEVPGGSSDSTTITIGTSTSAGIADIKGDSSTIFVVVDGDDDVTAYTGVANAPDITTSDGFTGNIYVGVVYKQSTGYAKYVFIDASADPNVVIDDANNAADYLFLLKYTGNKTVSGEDTYYKYKVVYDGVETEKYVESSLVSTQDNGMLFRSVKENSKGFVTKATLFEGDGYHGSDKRDDFTMAVSDNSIITYSNDTLSFSNTSDGECAYIITDKTNVTLALAKDVNLDLVDEGDDYTLYQTSAKSIAGLLNDYKLGGNVYVAVDDDGSEVATDIYIWIDAAVATTSGGGGSVSTSAVVLSAGDLTDATDMDLLSGEIAYYKASGANLTTTSEKWDLLEKAGCTDITLSGSNFTYTTPNGRTVTNSINLTRYYKVTVDGTTYYAKQNDVVKAGGNVDVAMTGIYYAINSDQPGSSSYKVANGYRVGTSDVEITSGFYLVKADALANPTGGTHSEESNITAVAMANPVYVQNDDTITVTLKATTATTSSAKLTFTGTGIVSQTITVDALDLNEEVKVTLEIDPDIADNISTGGISVKADTVTP